VEFLPLDLESLASARRCAELFLARGLPLHLLVNNAGLSDSGLTGDGFERQFQVNYLGHFLLTVLLLDRLRASAPARIIMVGSQVYMLSGGVDAAAVRRKCTWGLGIFGYGASKLAMVWGMQELKRRLEGTGVVVHTVHPGGVWTDIYAPWAPPLQWLIRMVSVTPEAAVDTILNPALLPEHGTPEASGRYFQELAVYPINATGSDLARARAFWDQCEVWAGLAPAVAPKETS
jgi:retinol dehydrogenase 12